MDNKNVLVIGYGSIGKQHSKNLVKLGIKPFVLTKFPDNNINVIFINELKQCKDIDFAIIATPTAGHSKDFKVISEICNKILIEKPVDMSVEKAVEVKRISLEKNIDVTVAYDMRFIRAFEIIREQLKENKDKIRLVKIAAGQYLPEWRPYKPYMESYSSHRDQGGGVDLDLSHEIDYMTWLFGIPDKIDTIIRDNLSTLGLESPDYFKGIYSYPHFKVDIELDYFRKKSRYIKILGENINILEYDFINNKMFILDKEYNSGSIFNNNNPLEDELKEFLMINPRKNLCTLDEGIETLKLLGLEN